MEKKELDQIRLVIREEVRPVIREEVRPVIREEVGPLKEAILENRGLILEVTRNLKNLALVVDSIHDRFSEPQRRGSSNPYPRAAKK